MFSKSLKFFTALHRYHIPTKIEHVAPLPPNIPSISNSKEASVISNAKIFDPDNWPLVTAENVGEKPSDEKEKEGVSAEEPDQKKEERDEIVEENRSEGHAAIKTALSALMQGLQQSSSMSTSLSDVDVTLFNFHSTKFAERLLNKNVSSVVIVESSHNFSKNAKRFAAHHCNVDGYRADIYSLMGVGRKKTTKLPKKLLFSGKVSEWEDNVKPLVLITDEHTPTVKSRKPHLLTVLPTATIQKTIIESLMQHAMLHHSDMDQDTLFAYGEANLLTFLSSGVLAQLLCSHDLRLQFLSHQNRRNSAVFNKLFKLNLLHTKTSKNGEENIPIGYSDKSFHPQLPSTKKIAHEKKLSEINFFNGLQYAVRISPRTSIEIAGKVLLREGSEHEQTLEPTIILPYAHFMNSVGKQSNAKQSIHVMRALWPETSLSIMEDAYPEKIGNMSDAELESIFLIVREELENSSSYHNFVHDMRIKRVV